jgi:hypothetical protein
MGTHAELIRARGHYYSLYTKQFRQETEQQRIDEAFEQEKEIVVM